MHSDSPPAEKEPAPVAHASPGSPPSRSGWLGWGWVVLLSAGVSAAVGAVTMGRALLSGRPAVRGDPSELSSYGFDLTNLQVPRDQLVGGAQRDQLLALDEPRRVDLPALERLAAERRGQHRGKLLVSTDRVIGVSLNGESRAYPLRILAWHEVANDTLGGVPIAVTYSGLCDSAVVFDRRLAGETLSFGVSGLLYASNLVLYDRSEREGTESLWSQLAMRAIAGPRAGRALAALPLRVATWEQWRTAHPETTVVLGRDLYDRAYGREPYATYFAAPDLRFPVARLPEPDGGLDWKTRILAVQQEGEWRLCTLDAAPTTEPSRAIDASRATARFAAAGGEAVVHSFWFAWYATHAEAVAVAAACLR